MQDEEIIQEIRNATEGVLSTMLGIEIRHGEAYTEQGAPGPTDGVVTLIGLAGRWIGTGSVSCSATMACKLAGQFLMTNFEAVTEEVLDAIAELTNMIIGNVKTAMEERLGPMGLSIPTVVFGRNFSTRSVHKKTWTVVPFFWEEGHFDVQVCLAPNSDQASSPRPGYTELHAIQD